MNRLTISGPLIVSLVALGIVALVALTSVPPMIAAALGGGTGSEDPTLVLAKRLQDHEAARETNAKRFLGRSPFFLPPSKPKDRPKPPPSEPVKVVSEPTPPPPPAEPRAPANYQGPSISFVVGKTVYFKPIRADDDVMPISVGEESEGVRVIEVNAPWWVKVGYMKGEYEVPIFVDNTESFVSAPEKLSGDVSRFIEVVEPAETAGDEDDADVETDAGDDGAVTGLRDDGDDDESDERRLAGGDRSDTSRRSVRGEISPPEGR